MPEKDVKQGSERLVRLCNRVQLRKMKRVFGVEEQWKSRARERRLFNGKLAILTYHQ